MPYCNKKSEINRIFFNFSGINADKKMLPPAGSAGKREHQRAKILFRSLHAETFDRQLADEFENKDAALLWAINAMKNS